MAITHPFVSGIADSAAAQAAGEVLPSHWNASHDLSQDNEWGGEQKFAYNSSSVSWLATDDQGYAFAFSREVSDFGNHIWNAGYNQGSTAYAGEPTLYLSMESNYDSGATNLMEYHLNYTSGDTLTTRRPFGVSVNRATHSPDVSYSADLVSYYNAAGTREQVSYVPTGVNNAGLVNFSDYWDSGANHFGIRYNLVSNDAAASGPIFLLSVAEVAKFRVTNAGFVGIGAAAVAGPTQMLDISNAGALAAIITDTTGTDTSIRLTVVNGDGYIDCFGQNNRLKFRTSDSGNQMFELAGNDTRVGMANFNGTATLSVWENIDTTGITELAIREGPGQSTNDSFVLYTDAGWSVKRASLNSEALRFYGAYTDSTNYVRAALFADSSSATLAAQTAGSGADNVSVNVTPAGTAGVNVGNFIQLTEMSAPSAGAANTARIFTVDNGGKTELMVQFASGTAIQLAIEV